MTTRPASANLRPAEPSPEPGAGFAAIVLLLDLFWAWMRAGMPMASLEAIAAQTERRIAMELFALVMKRAGHGDVDLSGYAAELRWRRHSLDLRIVTPDGRVYYLFGLPAASPHLAVVRAAARGCAFAPTAVLPSAIPLNAEPHARLPAPTLRVLAPP
jgi:hypothetical protein